MEEAEIEILIAAFEDTSLSHERWHHREHLIVAYWYVTHFDEKQALEKLRSGIMKFNAANDIRQTAMGGYHDTLTIFLAKKIRQFLKNLGESYIHADRLAKLLLSFADFKGITKEHYSEKLINSRRARMGWVEPDLKPLE